MIGDRWGVRDPEPALHYPCDDLVPQPAVAAWRAVTVDAPAHLVWPWVAQIRLGPYSYDWIDNLAHRSPRRLHGLAEPVVGANFSTACGRRVGRILSVSPGVSLTGRIVGATMSYVLVPDAGRTRLLLKVVTTRGRGLAPLLCLADLLMARRQLLNLKQLAEAPVVP